MLKERSCICFMSLEKAFDRVPWKVLEWAMMKKGIPVGLVRSVISLYNEAKTRVMVDSELSEKFEVKVGMHQGSALSSFLFNVEVDVVAVFAREDVLREMPYADDLVQMTEAIEGLRNKLLKWKEAFKSNCLKGNHGNTKVLVSGGMTKDGISKGKVDSCGVCSLRVTANSVLIV